MVVHAQPEGVDTDRVDAVAQLAAEIEGKGDGRIIGGTQTKIDRGYFVFAEYLEIAPSKTAERVEIDIFAGSGDIFDAEIAGADFAAHTAVGNVLTVGDRDAVGALGEEFEINESAALTSEIDEIMSLAELFRLRFDASAESEPFDGARSFCVAFRRGICTVQITGNGVRVIEKAQSKLVSYQLEIAVLIVIFRAAEGVRAACEGCFAADIQLEDEPGVGFEIGLGIVGAVIPYDDAQLV